MWNRLQRTLPMRTNLKYCFKYCFTPESEAIDEDIDEPSNQNAGTVSDGKEKTVAKEYSPRIKFRKITPIQQFLGKCEQRAKGRDELRQKLP